MDGLPQPDKFLKMVCRACSIFRTSDASHSLAGSRRRVRQSNSPIHPQIDDYLRFTSKAVNMTRRMNRSN